MRSVSYCRVYMLIISANENAEMIDSVLSMRNVGSLYDGEIVDSRAIMNKNNEAHVLLVIIV